MLLAMKEIINPDVVIECDTENKKLLLKEEGADSKIKKLYITNVPDNSFAFTLDHQPNGNTNRWFKQLSPYVNVCNDKGVNKGCDLIILWKDNNKFCALIFDLKSGKPNTKETQKQLNNSELFLRYLLTMVENYYESEFNNLEIKKAIITTDHRAVRKNATYRPSSAPTHIGDYHIQVVTPKAYKCGYVALLQLAR